MPCKRSRREKTIHSNTFVKDTQSLKRETKTNVLSLHQLKFFIRGSHRLVEGVLSLDTKIPTKILKQLDTHIRKGKMRYLIP